MSGMISTIGSKFLDLMADLFETAEIVTHGMHGHGAPTAILWTDPAEVEWVPGGFKLTSAQLNATTDRGPMSLDYDPPLSALLPVGVHTLTATLNSDSFEAFPATVTLTVARAKVKIDWATPRPMTFVPGGAVPGPAILNAVTRPFSAPLDYIPDPSGGLAVGTHRITATIRPGEPYEAQPVEVDIVVRASEPASTLQTSTPTLAATVSPPPTPKTKPDEPVLPTSAVPTPPVTPPPVIPLSSVDARESVVAAVRSADVPNWKATIRADTTANGYFNALGAILKISPFPVAQHKEALDLVEQLEGFMNRVCDAQAIFNQEFDGRLSVVESEVGKIRMRRFSEAIEQRVSELRERFGEIRYQPPQDFATTDVSAFRKDLVQLEDDIAQRLAYETAHLREGLIYTDDYHDLEGPFAVHVIARLGGERSSPDSPVMFHLHMDGDGSVNMLFQDTGSGPVKVLGRVFFHIDSETMKNRSNQNDVAKVEARASGGFTKVLVDKSTNEIQRD